MGVSQVAAGVAFSAMKPSSLPFASRPYLPPAGSGVSSVMPTRANAFEFAYAVWPPRCWMMTGWSGRAASRSAREMRRPSVVFVSSYLKPVTHSPAGVRDARSRSASLIAPIERRSQSTENRWRAPA